MAVVSGIGAGQDADATVEADLFLSLLPGRPQRAAMVDWQPMDQHAINRRVRGAVGIFLHGVGV